MHDVRSKRVEKQKQWAEFLISQGADPNARDDEGCTPLISACYDGSKDLIEFFLNHGADVNHRCEYSSGHIVTPLLKAVYHNDREVIELLLDRGADINQQDQEGHTALHDAVYNHRPEIVSFLIERGADVNARGGDFKQSPLHMAVFENDSFSVTSLIQAGADVNIKNAYGATPLHVAVSCPFPPETRPWHPGVDHDFYYEFLERGNHVMVGMLLNNGADINARDDVDYTPLHLAALSVRRTLDESYEENPDSFTATMKLQKNEEGLKMFEEVGFAEPGEYTSAPEPRWLFIGNEKVAGMLIEAGADVNAKGAEGETPLILARLKGNDEVADLLVKNGADQNVTDQRGRNASDLAEEEGAKKP